MPYDATDNASATGGSEPTVRKVQLIRIGSLQFGVFENEIAGIANWREPTPLPNAPDSVMGVVSIQGRMLTVLDFRTLSGFSSDGSPKHILALRGDEQLALAIDTAGKTIEIGDANIRNKQDTERFVLGVFDHDGTEISIMNVKELFPTAIQGRERRRRRF